MIIQFTFRNGNSHSQGKHNVPGIFLRKQNSQPELPKPGLQRGLNPAPPQHVLTPVNSYKDWQVAYVLCTQYANDKCLLIE